MKQRMHRRLIAAALAALTLLLSACAASGGPDAPNSDTAPVTGTVQDATAETEPVETEPAETDRADARDALPDDLNLGGETLRIFARNDQNILNYDVIGTDNTGNIVFDAVWERNQRVQERLNVKLDVHPSESTSLNELKTLVPQMLRSGADDYDMFITTDNSFVQNGLIAYLRAFNGAPYLDFDAPWWWTSAMLDLSLDNETIHYLLGDLLTRNILTSAVIFANKDIWQNHFGDPDKMYDIVWDGKWTLDTFGEYARAAYQDVNGNGTLDEEDVVGFYGNEYQTIDYLTIGSDIYFVTHGEDGRLVLNPPDEKVSDFAEKLINLFYNEGAAMISASSDESKLVPGFTQNRCLFLPDCLMSTTKAAMREMESDFAILPIPKYDENQAQYNTLCYGHSTNVCVPITVNDDKFAAVCATVEALSAESYRSVTEKLYETALKVKYSRDAKSAQMLDLIMSNTRKNLVNEYGATLANMHRILHIVVSSKSNTVTSEYKKTENAAKESLNKLFAELDKIKG